MACKLIELRVYYMTFMRNLSDSCTHKSYQELAQFAGSRYILRRCQGVSTTVTTAAAAAAAATAATAAAATAAAAAAAARGGCVATSAAAAQANHQG